MFQETKRRLAGAPGIFGNIFTSALGDTGFGKSVAAPAAGATYLGVAV